MLAPCSLDLRMLGASPATRNRRNPRGARLGNAVECRTPGEGEETGMAETSRRIGSVFEEVLADATARPPAEAAIEPDLPIIDPHHHLRERPGHRYLLHELLRD